MTYGQILDLFITEVEALSERYLHDYTEHTVVDYDLEIVKFRVIKDMHAITIVIHMKDIVRERILPLDVILEILEVRKYVG